MLFRLCDFRSNLCVLFTQESIQSCSYLFAEHRICDPTPFVKSTKVLHHKHCRSYAVQCILQCTCSYNARCTLADLMSRFTSDYVGMSEANQDEAFRRHVRTPLAFAEWRAMRTFTLVGTVKESYLLHFPLK